LSQRNKTRLEELLEKKLAEKRAVEDQQRLALGIQPKSKSAKNHKAKSILPKFLTDPKVKQADHRVFARFMKTQGYENVHDATQARDAIQRAHRHLDTIFQRDTNFANSGLLGEEKEEIRKDLKRQGKLLVLLRAALKEVSDDRARRLHELVELEEALEREAVRQRIEAERKLKSARKLAQVTYQTYEEPGAPTINLDPTLIAEATRGLRADPDKINRKAAGNSRKRNTGTSVGKVSNGEVQQKKR